MAGGQGRWGVVAAVALAAGLSGCVVGGSLPSKDPDLARLHDQAQAALVRWANAVTAAGDQQGFVPVGELTAQVGDWEEKVGSNNKSALMAGLVQSAGALSAQAPPVAELRWPDGTAKTVRVISAQEAIAAMKADGNGSCTDCVPLQLIGARLTTGPIETSRGPATGPVWDFTVKGTAVHVTRVAIAGRVSVVPPPWDPNDAPVGIWIESASGTVGGRQLTVTFIGAPGRGDRPCGADYTAEAVESTTAVVVLVAEHRNGFVGVCTLVGAERTATVELVAPLADRAVLEVRQGLPVPVVLTP